VADGGPDWQPTAQIETLKKRAEILKIIRGFFETRNITEVETPILSAYGITDPEIESITASYHRAGKIQDVFLQTSPEFAMKRLLAAGIGDCYQMSRVFRNDEIGRYHNPEFSLLEWYRVGFDDKKLMQEIDLFLQEVFQSKAADYIDYKSLFLKYLQLDPLNCSFEEVEKCAFAKTSLASVLDSKAAYLQLLFCEKIEPEIGTETPCFVTDFPAAQASLARINSQDESLSCRFEIYFQGVELGNGFYELKDADEQYARFVQDNLQREKAGMRQLAIDHRFIAALSSGLPDCAGVAIGLDRLMMIALKAKKITEVMAFPVTNA